MNVAIKMLSIATFVLWATILVFSATAAFSVMGINFGVGELEMLPSTNGMTFSLPFYINNNGYYDLADLNITTRVTDNSGGLIDQTETFVPSISVGENVSAAHSIEIDLDDILSMDHTTLLLEDGEFNVEIFGGLDFARAVPVEISLNTTIPWGGPFADFSIGTVTASMLNSSHGEISIPISFENHAILDISGTVKLEVYNNYQQKIASGQALINAPSQQSYSGRIRVSVDQQNVMQITSSGRIHIIFETPMFTVDWWEHYG